MRDCPLLDASHFYFLVLSLTHHHFRTMNAIQKAHAINIGLHTGQEGFPQENGM